MDAEGLNALSKQALDAAYRVHSELGPGLLESAYGACLAYELERLPLQVRREVPPPLVYDGVKLFDVGYRIDLLVAEELILEVKAIEVIVPVHTAQLVSYLKLARKRLGLLLNFMWHGCRMGSIDG